MGYQFINKNMKQIKWKTLNRTNPNQPDEAKSWIDTTDTYSKELLSKLKKYESLGYVKNIIILK